MENEADVVMAVQADANSPSVVVVWRGHNSIAPVIHFVGPMGAFDDSHIVAFLKLIRVGFAIINLTLSEVGFRHKGKGEDRVIHEIKAGVFRRFLYHGEVFACCKRV